MEEKKVLTPQEVADELGVSLRLIYRQLRKGAIPHCKVGDRFFVSRAALDKFESGEYMTAGSQPVAK